MGGRRFELPLRAVLLLCLERPVRERAGERHFLTVPILDARLAIVISAVTMVDARVDALDVKLSTRIDFVEAKLSTRIDSVETKLGARIDSVEAKLGADINSMGARMDSMEGRLNAKIERWSLGIIIAMVLSQTALGPIEMRAFESMKQVVATVGH